MEPVFATYMWQRKRQRTTFKVEVHLGGHGIFPSAVSFAKHAALFHTILTLAL